MIYMNNGEMFSPSKDELMNVLLFLKGVFAPNTLDIFDGDMDKRFVLSKSMEKPFLYMDILAGSKEHPDFDLLIKNGVDNLPFSVCAQYMMFCILLMRRQGGNDSLCTMWKSGIIEKLIDRMLRNIDICEIS